MSRATFAILMALLLVWGTFGSFGLISWAAQHFLRGPTPEQSTELDGRRNTTVITKSNFR